MKFFYKLIFVLLLAGIAAGQVWGTGRAQEPQPVTPPPAGPGADTKIQLPFIRRGVPSAPIAGVEMGTELAQADPGQPAEIMASAGAAWVRYNGLLWSNVEPTPGARKWEAQVDNSMLTAAKYNMRSILVIRSTPSWAQKDPGWPCGPIKQDSLDEFATFVHDVVARYSAPPYNVLYYELWNEPDVDRKDPMVSISPDFPYGCWGDVSDTQYYGGKYYAEMLKQVYPAVKRANATAQVLVGGLLLYCDPANPPSWENPSNPCVRSKFLNGILANGGGSYLDGVAFHAYDLSDNIAYTSDPNYALGVYNNKYWLTAWNTTGPTIIRKTEYLKGVLSQYGFANKYLMSTETGMMCFTDSSGVKCDARYPATSASFQNTKAYFTVQTTAIAAALGLKNSIWYAYYGWWFSGIWGQYSNKLDPMYEAYRFTAKELSGFYSPKKLSLGTGLMAYEFLVPGKKVWVVWYVGGTPTDGKQTTTINLAAPPKAVYRWINVGSGSANEGTYQPAAISQSLSIGRGPVFIELNP